MTTERVHVVFKTHLDIGFTDLSKNVVRNYMQDFLPRAIALARRLNTPPHKRFVWTVGSWLIDYAFKHGDAGLKSDLEQAIRSGDIAWHALPFTTHTELMDLSLFEYGLSLSQRLDQRFGRQTIAAKMTDVPGHTSAMLAPLAAAGVRFLHIGVNSVSRKPDVPPLFCWQDGCGNSILAGYAQGYGGVMQAPGSADALVFVHSNDNAGPPDEQTVMDAFAALRREYPGARVQASTLDAFARALLQSRASLPVVTGEIGDTWIHGVGTDPYKVSVFKALSRLGARWREQGIAAPDAFYDALLMVPEHTWGLDTKKYLSDFTNWSKADFARARALDTLADADADVPGYAQSLAHARQEYGRMQPPAAWQARSYGLFESSHQEQRDYLDQAVAALEGGPLAQARQALAQCDPGAHAQRLRDLCNQGMPVAANQSLTLAGHCVRVLPNGSAALEGAGGMVLGAPVYRQHGTRLYENFRRDYMNIAPQDEWWAKIDYFKPGMALTGLLQDTRRFDARTAGAWRMGDTLVVGSRFEGEACSLYGAPREILTAYEFAPERVGITAVLCGKDANRLPEALYLAFTPQQQMEGLYLKKLGRWIDPAHVVAGGNDRYHAVQAARFEARGARYLLRPLDTPLLSPGGMSLLDFTGGRADFSQGLYVNLYNNLWGTNFKMWYEEDILARFELAIQ